MRKFWKRDVISVPISDPYMDRVHAFENRYGYYRPTMTRRYLNGDMPAEDAEFFRENFYNAELVIAILLEKLVARVQITMEQVKEEG